MALSYPLSLDLFWEKLRLQSTLFHLGENREDAETGGGEIIGATTGPMLWQGSCTLLPGTRAQTSPAFAFLDALRQPGRSFLAYDPVNAAPQMDPDGAILGAANVTLSGVSANNVEVSIAGLPVGYELTSGDHISVAYGATPKSYYLGRVLIGGLSVASGGTTRCDIELSHFVSRGLRAAFQSEQLPVSLVRPVCKAVIIPESFEGGELGTEKTESASFRWRQTLR